MDLVDLTKYLVINLVKDRDSVSVTMDDNNIIDVLVSEEDIGRIIGYKGKIANSIRNIVQASAYANELGYVKINFNAK